MSVARPRQEGVTNPVPAAAPQAHAQPFRDAGKPAPARLADDLAVPAPSPVHRLQAGLAHLTAPGDARADDIYPGWLRLGFPVIASLTMWGAILWGIGLFG